MKILGFEIKKIVPAKPEIKECTHDNSEAGDLSAGIYHCRDCGKACIYIDQKLTPLTLDNGYLNDKGKTINGIFQF